MIYKCKQYCMYDMGGFIIYMRAYVLYTSYYLFFINNQIDLILI